MRDRLSTLERLRRVIERREQYGLRNFTLSTILKYLRGRNPHTVAVYLSTMTRTGWLETVSVPKSGRQHRNHENIYWLRPGVNIRKFRMPTGKH